MNTPIADFVRTYAGSSTRRLHMPGHKGRGPMGFEAYDITEIAGADALYEAEGIIAESESNASRLFGTQRTLFSTEGSSQCIRAMLYLACGERKIGERPLVVAARNVHKAFVYAAALADFDVEWLMPENSADSLCACPVSAEALAKKLDGMDLRPAAVYITSPDYLGGMQDISALAAVCHDRGILLLVDNAHGAYLKFCRPSLHPMDLGADICCDSAHKTLPVLTGGAYLHISKNAPSRLAYEAKAAMALFGSTSPSYLTLCSLDLCNKYLSEGYSEKLEETAKHIGSLCHALAKNGWQSDHAEPLKLTVHGSRSGVTGTELADRLRAHGCECEFADPDDMVLMFTPENTPDEIASVAPALGMPSGNSIPRMPLPRAAGRAVMTIREAFFAPHERIPACEALGRICAAPTVACPPAIPIAVSGEVITPEAITLFDRYGVRYVEVVRK